MPFYPSEGFSGFDPTYISEGLTFEEGKAMARPWEMAVGGRRFCTQVFYKDKYVDLINSFCVAYEKTDNQQATTGTGSADVNIAIDFTEPFSKADLAYVSSEAIAYSLSQDYLFDLMISDPEPAEEGATSVVVQRASGLLSYIAHNKYLSSLISAVGAYLQHDTAYSQNSLNNQTQKYTIYKNNLTLYIIKIF